MMFRDSHPTHTIFVALCMAAAFAACGGGSGGTSSGTTGGSGKPTGTPKTPSATQRTQSLQATPTPLPTATSSPLIIVPSGRSIVDYVRIAPPGSRVIVPPGSYAPFTLSASDVQGPIELFADVSGVLTQSAGYPVTIDAHGQEAPAAAAIALSGIPGDRAVVIDGFTLRGGTSAGIVVDGSPGTTIRNCTFESNPGDGALLTGSDQSLVFNNLIFNNSGAGVRALGTNQLQLFNNSIYQNADSGIVIGSDQDASPNAVVENNIVNSNTPVGIAVAANSTTGYDGNFNLNSDQYAAGTPIGMNDLNKGMYAVPQFISTTGDDPFLLAASSPAVDAGDPATPASLWSLLQEGTTQADGTPDCQLVDLGYHYPTDQGCFAPTATPTKIPTKTKKPTATPTPIPPTPTLPTPTPTQ
jgi:parallel beta-helix repeat protein